MRIGGQAAPVLDRLGVARRSRQDRLWRGSLSAGTARPADRLVARDKRREYRAGDLQPAFLILPVPRLTSFAPRMACELVAEDWRANYVEFAQAEHSRKTFRVAVPPPHLNSANEQKIGGIRCNRFRHARHAFSFAHATPGAGGKELTETHDARSGRAYSS